MKNPVASTGFFVGEEIYFTLPRASGFLGKRLFNYWCYDF